MAQQLRAAVLMTVVLVAITGLAYPFAVTDAAQLLFPGRANGSFIEQNGTVVGSAYLGQAFTGPRYFHGRISAADATAQNPNGYDPMASGASNLGPTNPALIDRVKATIVQIAKENGVAPSQIPADAVYASGSGLDPDISPAYAAIQAPRVARARGMSEDAVRALVKKYTSGRQFGVLGEPRVNVLKLNLALDAAAR